MEVAPSGPQTVPEPLRRRTLLPLSQLVEESRANVPNHLLESKIYAKLKSNSMVQAEPPELHFSGFELGRDCFKILKLINISSEVMNIHIIPTQTKHFQTTYTKKCRLVPGLAYTLKVRFCPNEWRYFYDCVQVHCKGEENLLIPVHAYPVIDDLHIPPRIDLAAVPLGQSVSHVIPLRCSCPIDFEFQVYVIQPHEAFSICPLSDVIPANGEVKLTVTFSPVRYETSEVTIQLVISQFNTKPYLCTITGSCGPLLALRSQQGRQSGHGNAGHPECRRPSPPKQLPPQSKTKYRSNKDAGRLKLLRYQSGLMRTVDVSTPAGVAKILIKDPSKLSSKALKEAVSCGSMVGLQTKQMKEALFLKKVQENVKEEQANHFRWRNHLGKEPVSAQTRRQILEERQRLRHEYMVQRGDVRPEGNFPGGPPKLSSGRVLCEAGQAPEGEPAFHFHSGFHPQLRQQVLRPFQQAARKIVVQCRADRRLACLKKLPYITRSLSSAEKAEEKTCGLKITPDKILPFSFPVFSDEDDPLVLSNLVLLPEAPIDVTVTTRIPFFRLQVPQRYKLMGYEPVTTWESFNSYIPTALARPLRTGPPDDDWAQTPSTAQAKAAKDHGAENEEEALRALEDSLSFTAPEALLKPPPANPLRIFNPAPGLQTYKPNPKYMESDLEFHLCPVPRYSVSENNVCGTRTRTLHTQKKLPDQEEVIRSFMTWRNFNVVTLNCLSDQTALTSDSAMRRSVDYSTDILPLTAPPLLNTLPDDVTPLMDKECEVSGIHLTPEMIRAEFLLRDDPMSNGNHTTRTTASNQRKLQMKVAHGREFNQMGKRVMARLNQLGLTASSSYSLGNERQQREL